MALDFFYNEEYESLSLSVQLKCSFRKVSKNTSLGVSDQFSIRIELLY